jgi:hypothetical protein
MDSFLNTTVPAMRLQRAAFCEEARLPSGVMGPVDLAALARLARI